MKKIFIVLLPVILLVVFALYFSNKKSIDPAIQEVEVISPSTFPTTSETVSTETPPSILDNLAKWEPEITWGESQVIDSQRKEYVIQVSRVGKGTSSKNLFPVETKIDTALIQEGWTRGSNFEAGGVGGEAHGYTKNMEGKENLLLIETATTAKKISTEGPVQYEKCPCPYKITVSLFVP